MDHKPLIFISYSRNDRTDDKGKDDPNSWFKAIHGQLAAVLGERSEIWVDQTGIHAGADWPDKIDAALERANLALLLITPSFLDPEGFIIRDELPKLLARRRDGLSWNGLTVIPILVKTVAWEAIDWLKTMNLRPASGKALDQFGKPDSPKVRTELAKIVKEIAGMIDDLMRQRGSGPARPRVPDAGTRDPIGLLMASVLQEVDADAREPLAGHIVATLAKLGGFDGEALFDATRLFIEHCLLRPELPSSPAALRQMIDHLDGSELDEPLLAALEQGAGSGDFSAAAVEVNSRFFTLARQREAAWERYFEEIDRRRRKAAGGAPPATLLRIRAHGEPGFIAPQFLVAGLMSHFDDDWRPVLNAYHQQSQRAGWFESLQASQWNCWLVWGPSIPLCRCAQWQGRFAYQYGYGDEDNSLPLIELETGDEDRPLQLDRPVAALAGEGRAARQLRLSGRLRWGPHFLASREPAAGQYPFAAAEESICLGSGPAHAHHSDGLVLQLERLEPTAGERRAYFSAYLWMMFLVAGAADADTDGAGPPLLGNKPYPPWPEQPGDRVNVGAAHLWESLLPVFVHANIADPAALQFQRRMLVDSAIALLRQLWARRGECFDKRDVERGIRFHLVCSSDYSGCGCAVRYPAREPLPELLRRRLAEEADAADAADGFAAAVVVPATADEPDRPWGLARYFASCHLPAMVDDYFRYIGQVELEKTKRQSARRR